MKSSPYVETIGQDGLYLVTKATELFIHYLTEEAHLQNNKGTSLDYKHLAEVVQTNDTLDFLREIMPRKITVRQFKEMMAARNTHSSSSESSSDSDSDSESDTDSYTDSDDRKDDESNENGKCESVSDKSETNEKSDSEDDSKR